MKEDLPLPRDKNHEASNLRLFLIVAGLLIVSIGLLSRVIVRSGQDKNRALRLTLAENLAAEVSTYLDSTKEALSMPSHSPNIETMVPERQTETLSQIANLYPRFTFLALLDLNGKELAFVNRMGSKPLDEEKVAVQSLQSLEGEYLGTTKRSPEGYPLISMAVPIAPLPGHPTGILFGEINLMDLSSMLKSINVGESGYAYIVDMGNGQLIAHPEIGILLSLQTPSEVRLALQVPADQVSGDIQLRDPSHHKVMLTYCSIAHSGLHWRVIVQEPGVKWRPGQIQESPIAHSEDTVNAERSAEYPKLLPREYLNKVQPPMTTEPLLNAARDFNPVAQQHRDERLLLERKNGYILFGSLSRRPIILKAIPTYPEWAKQQHMRGEVQIFFYVSPDGHVEPAPRVMKSTGYPKLDAIAVDAVKQWQFAPGNGAQGNWGLIAFFLEPPLSKS